MPQGVVATELSSQLKPPKTSVTFQDIAAQMVVKWSSKEACRNTRRRGRLGGVMAHPAAAVICLLKVLEDKNELARDIPVAHLVCASRAC